MTEAERKRKNRRNRRYYKRNKTKVKARVEAWKAEHPGAVRGYSRKFWQGNASKLKRRRAKKRAEAYARDPRAAWLTETLRAAKSRAKTRGHAFDVDRSAIDLPAACPVLGIRLAYERGASNGPRASSPSLDRVMPGLGYVTSNLRVISHRANTLKNDATLDELRAVIADLERCRRY